MVKGISVANPIDIEKGYIEKTVDYAIAKGYTHFQFIGPIHNYIRGNIDGMTLSKKYSQFNNERDIDYINLNIEVINSALEKLNSANIKTYMWHHELDLPTGFETFYPEILNKNGDIEVSHPRVKDYLENRLKDFFNTYPKMDGIILTLHETKVPLLKLQNQVLDKIERVRHITKILYDTCKELGKELIVRPFASIAEDYEMMTKAYEEISNDLVVMDKWTQFDWSLTLPNNKFFEKINNNPLLIETDIFGEYFGKGRLPLMLNKHIIEKVNYCKKYKHIGYVNRIDRAGKHPFETINEVNLDIMYAAMSENSVDTAIENFFYREYPKCSNELKQIMEETEELNRKLLNCNNYYYSQGSFFPMLNHSKNHFYFEMMKKDYCIASNEWFIPLDWKRGDIQDLFREKDYVVARATELLSRVKKLYKKVSEEKYKDILVKFNNLYYASKIWRKALEVFYNYVNYFDANDSIYETLFYTSVQDLKDIDREGKSVVGDDDYYLNYHYNKSQDKTKTAIDFFSSDIIESFEIEKREHCELKDKGCLDYIICGAGNEGHKLQKEVNFSDTLINNGKLCRIPGNNKGVNWSRINAHGWFSYEIKIKPNEKNIIMLEVGSLGDYIDFKVAIEDERYEFSKKNTGDEMFMINFNETRGKDKVRIRVDRISSYTPLIYKILVNDVVKGD